MRTLGSAGLACRTGPRARARASGAGSRPLGRRRRRSRHHDHRSRLGIVDAWIGRSRRPVTGHPVHAAHPARGSAASIRERASGSGAASVTPTSSRPWRAASCASVPRFICPGDGPRTAAARRSARSRPAPQASRPAECGSRRSSSAASTLGADQMRPPCIDGRAADVEAQAKATEASPPGLAIGLVEAFEDVLAVLVRDAEADVRHADLDLRRGTPRRR